MIDWRNSSSLMWSKVTSSSQLIQHKFVYLPPALILATQFLMDIFVGVIGVTFATPLMVIAMVLIKKLYFKQEWDEPTDEPAAA